MATPMQNDAIDLLMKEHAETLKRVFAMFDPFVQECFDLRHKWAQVKSGVRTLDDFEQLENMQVREMPRNQAGDVSAPPKPEMPKPLDTCIEEISKGFGDETPEKKDTKNAVEV